MIDWNEILEEVNSKREKKFETVNSMLEIIYSEQRSTRKMGGVMGVSHQTVNNAMKSHGLQMLSRGGRNNYFKQDVDLGVFGVDPLGAVLVFMRVNDGLTVRQISDRLAEKGIRLHYSRVARRLKGIRGC